VKAISFNFMSYQDFPSDFTETEESVWVDFDSRLVDPVRMHELYNLYLDQFEYAEQAGLDAVCVNEHHASGYGTMPSPNLMAAALARRTSEAAVMTLGTSLALYNPPVRVAEEYAMLDVLTGGRVIAGFPVGTPMDGPFAYSVNPSELRARYLEAHDLILKAWATDGPFSWNGRFHQMRYVNVVPKPVQRPRPPIWVPGGGSLETWDFCGLHDYVYCYLTYFGLVSGAEMVKAYWARMKDLGKDPNPYRLTLTQFVAVADSRKEAIDLYREPANYFFRDCLHVSPRFMNPPGYMSEASLRFAFQKQAERSKVETSSLVGYGSHSFEDMVDNGWVMVGSPTEVAEQLAEQCRTSNIGNVIVVTSYGRMSRELAQYNMDLFAHKVLPELRGLHSEWEHEWWPKPLSERVGAAPLAAGAQNGRRP
jgi:alkanesulfonate monooxygenase SsuD/methylene tetrahydromethanopterin reductase-like flavin-dependent oxidoreductase (luciferase family)